MNEAETRAEHIDPALAAAGWGVVEGSRIRREYPITLGRIEGRGRRGKSLTADYVLEYRNTKLATVEAKAWDQALTEGVGQAKDDAAKLAIRHPYATNGQPAEPPTSPAATEQATAITGKVIGISDGDTIDLEIVKSGLAWHYVKYAPDDKALAAAEAEARTGKLGLWSDRRRVAPWDWRKLSKAERDKLR